MFTTATAPNIYAAALATAQTISDNVRQATTEATEILARTDLTTYLSDDHRSGFAVSTTGELVGVFSTERGRGDLILSAAVAAGATHLDCFDGYLPSLYARHGFRETSREPNWTPGGPDVVYMAR